MKISIIVLPIIIGILISGCIDNPMKEVPIVKVNVTFIEKDGFVEAVGDNTTQGIVSYLKRPQREQAPFPAIAARTMITKGKNSSIGQWEVLPYTGPGIYSFNIGFVEEKYPVTNDSVHVSIYVVNEKGERIGFITKDIVWK